MSHLTVQQRQILFAIIYEGRPVSPADFDGREKAWASPHDRMTTNSARAALRRLRERRLVYETSDGRYAISLIGYLAISEPS